MEGRTPIRLAAAQAFLMVIPCVFAGLSMRTPAAAGAVGGNREAVQKSLDLLDASARQWRAGCVSCHHHALQVVTANAARTRGFKVDGSFLHDQLAFILSDLARSRPQFDAASSLESEGRLVGPNPDMILGYALFGLAETRVPSSAVTDATVRYLLGLRDRAGNWRSRVKQRPPFEASDVAATALAVRVIREYTPSDRVVDARKAATGAEAWLARVRTADTEDRAFGLLGLHWAGAGKVEVERAGRDLLAHQRSDGGWAQTDALSSDAYATGQSLVALRAAGIVRKKSPPFERGIDFLLRTQAADGSWHVQSRAEPIQKFFDTGFPYAADQFISYAATCWATLAILSDDDSPEGALR